MQTYCNILFAYSFKYSALINPELTKLAISFLKTVFYFALIYYIAPLMIAVDLIVG